MSLHQAQSCPRYDDQTSGLKKIFMKDYPSNQHTLHKTDTFGTAFLLTALLMGFPQSLPGGKGAEFGE
jgi:hypothetical protein